LRFQGHQPARLPQLQIPGIELEQAKSVGHGV
jgi:hypothetical protein